RRSRSSSRRSGAASCVLLVPVALAPRSGAAHHATARQAGRAATVPCAVWIRSTRSVPAATSGTSTRLPSSIVRRNGRPAALLASSPSTPAGYQTPRPLSQTPRLVHANNHSDPTTPNAAPAPTRRHPVVLRASSEPRPTTSHALHVNSAIVVLPSTTSDATVTASGTTNAQRERSRAVAAK